MSSTAQDHTTRLLLLAGARSDSSIAAWPPRIVAGFKTSERVSVGDALTIDGELRIVRSRHLADDGSPVMLLF